MGEEAAIRGKIDMNSPAVERAGGGVRGIAGTVMPLVGHFNGIVFYFYGKAITIDVYVMKDWHTGKTISPGKLYTCRPFPVGLNLLCIVVVLLLVVLVLK